ncbi:hypothetical protein [uncultured Hymenobacter sp.]|uniref:hypothetical protein n=1 Tax=uncultured Hymenobacter sp. TaxID=170016 RepID=UPI0035CC0A17
MKNTFVLLAAFLISAGVASAQTAPAKVKNKVKTDQSAKVKKTPEQKATHTAQQMAKNLNLTAAQTEQVRQLDLTRHQEMQAKRAQFASADKAKQREEMRAGKEKYEAQLKQILNAEQYAKYTQLRAAKLEKHKTNRKMKS